MAETYSHLIEDIAAAGLKAPQHLTLMITPHCNLECIHCWLDCVPQRLPEPVPRDACVSIIRDFARVGGQGITITGGEALTHPDWLEILSQAYREKSLACVRLQTNATLLTDSMVTDLKRIFRQGCRIQVSLDGATARTHDHVRGTGSFDRTLKGLMRLTAAGLGQSVEMALTEMAHNFDELPAVLELAEKLGIKAVVSGTMIRGGRAARADELNMPAPKQYHDMVTRYHEDEGFRKRYGRLGRISALEWFLGKSHPTGHVCSCIEHPFISADGRMYPCVMFLNDNYAGSNVHRNGMASVIRTMLPRWADLPKRERHRQASLSECRDCVGWAHCKGGCMGRADAVHGDPMTPEDRCQLRQAVYSWPSEE
ncbi:hypothetical protein D3OALGB2SA_5791 [Olavius algarvensis associated proteobacterium Delta 3]|nr:hypothetical protein D3OALGB2SA_5791 [Olavius algarvensis associated proteobacterium Delta 3]